MDTIDKHYLYCKIKGLVDNGTLNANTPHLDVVQTVGRCPADDAEVLDLFNRACEEAEQERINGEWFLKGLASVKSRFEP